MSDDTGEEAIAEGDKQSDLTKSIPLDTFIDLAPNGERNGVYKRVKRAGAMIENPCDSDTVYVHYTGRFWGGSRDGEQFDSSRDRGEVFKFQLGKHSVIRGWEAAIVTMTRGEVAELICLPSFAYGSEGSDSIPPNATLFFEVELLDFHGEDISAKQDQGMQRPQQPDGLSPIDRVAEARRCNERANAAFAKKHFGLAENHYKRALLLLASEQETAEAQTLRCCAFANLAQTHLNLNNYKLALRNAEKALEIQPHHLKALFRKGVALARLDELQKARLTFQHLLSLEPANRSAISQLAACDARLQELAKSEKKVYQTMFQKLASRQEDELDKLERERAEKAKARREAREKRKFETPKKKFSWASSSSSSSSDDEP